jgi:hypothetical protein
MIEVLMVVSLILILATVGFGTTQNQMPRYRLIQASKGMKGDLMTLRSLAVETGRETRLVLAEAPADCSDGTQYGGKWRMEIGDSSRRATWWEQLPPDASEDGTDDDLSQGEVDIGDGGNRKARDVCLMAWSPIRGPATGNSDAIVFSPRGWLVNPSEDFDGTGHLVVQLANQAAARDGVVDRVRVMVTRSGMVRLHSTLGEEMSDTPVSTEGSSTAP